MEIALYNKYSLQTANPGMIENLSKVTANREYMENNIFTLLNKATEYQWTYTIVNGEYSDKSMTYSAQVEVYVPGRFMMGIGVEEANSKDAKEKAIRKAVTDAVYKMFCQNIVQYTGSAAQPERLVDAPVEYNSSTATPAAPVQQNVQPQVQQQTNPQPAPQQQQRPKLFTDEQVKKMNHFKDDFKITNDEQLMAHIMTWNPSITSKTQLNSTNIEDFLKYVDKLNEVEF